MSLSSELTALVEKIPSLAGDVAKFQFSNEQNKTIVEHAEILSRLAVELDLEFIKVGAIEIRTRIKHQQPEIVKADQPPPTEEELLYFST